jgi:outer membrane protein assembly factor BamA
MTPNRILSTICVSILVTTAIFAQSARKIAGIETEGLQALTAETVIATAGLKIGQTFSVEAIDAAAERLVRAVYSKGLRIAPETRAAM